MMTKMRIIQGSIATGIFVFGSVLFATGAASAGKSGDPLACIKDAKKLCKGVKSGGGRILECLAKSSKLRPDCKKVIAPRRTTIRFWRDTCGRDIDKRCTNTPAGAPLKACLNKNKNKLRSECRSALNHAQVTAMLSCMADSAKLCQGIESGGGRVIECLAKKESKLSSDCKNAVRPIKLQILNWRKACGRDHDQV